MTLLVCEPDEVPEEPATLASSIDRAVQLGSSRVNPTGYREFTPLDGGADVPLPSLPSGSAPLVGLRGTSTKPAGYIFAPSIPNL